MLSINKEEKENIDKYLTVEKQKQLREIIYQYLSDIESVCSQTNSVSDAKETFQKIVKIFINDFERNNRLSLFKNLKVPIDSNQDSIAMLSIYMDENVQILLDRLHLFRQEKETKKAVVAYVKQLLFEVVNDASIFYERKQPEKLELSLFKWVQENEKKYHSSELTNKYNWNGTKFVKFGDAYLNSLPIPNKIVANKSERAENQLILDADTLNDLTEYFLQTDLEVHQKQMIIDLTTAFRKNVGICVFNQDKNQKFILTSALLRFLIPHEDLYKPFLIITSPEDAAKWKIKLEHMHFHPSEIIEIFYENQDMVSFSQTQIKVVVITLSMLMQHLKGSKVTFLKMACGFISPSTFSLQDDEAIKKWQAFRSQLPNFTNLPDEPELTELCSSYELDSAVFKSFFYSEKLYALLIDKDYVDKNGAILKSFDAIDELEIFFEEISGITLDKDYIYTVFNNLANQIAWSGLIFDNEEVLNKRNFKYLEDIVRSIKLGQCLRLMFDSKMKNNTLDRLSIIDDFLNGIPCNMRGKSINSYKQDLINIGMRINSIAIEDKTECADNISRVSQDILKAYEKFNDMVSYFKMRQFYSFNEDGILTLPKVEPQLIYWSPSVHQEHDYHLIAEEAIEEIGRGFSFFKNDSSSKIKPTFITNKQVLNCLQRLLDHPILVRKEHQALFKDKKTIFQQHEYLLNAVQNSYNNDANNLIKESGKLLVLQEKLQHILKTDHSAKIVIVTEYSEAAALIKLTIGQTFPDIGVSFYNWQFTKMKEIWTNEFNNPHMPHYDQNKIIILCPSMRQDSVFFNANYFIFFDELWISSAQEDLFNFVYHPKNIFKTIHKIHFSSLFSLDSKIQQVLSEKKAWNEWMALGNQNQCDINWFIERIRQFTSTTPFFENDNDSKNLSKTIHEIKRKIGNESFVFLANVNKKREVDKTTEHDSDGPSKNKKFRKS